MAGPLGVSRIGREVVPEHQPHRDVECGGQAHRADDPPVRRIHEGPRVRQSFCQHSAHTDRFAESREAPKSLTSLVSAVRLEPTTP